MTKQKKSVANHALLVFAGLDEFNQQRFISSMNEFLLASPKHRRQMIEQWERDDEHPAAGDSRTAEHC
ncbi:hypothetical protein LMG24238_05613 [Paraburkholderia sediminicola]|uniref:Uncharacterized protein n=1 Tax=Paraburkholderia sediminicola TaxID=458836 RepID=A0A6J5C7L6_9BURK|nr:hypothetical protein [Paraburkholderia sediminicola]CAB3729727.1 hypothetical protein LMG24238_05613 [Paraburkholderia sediminicola]